MVRVVFKEARLAFSCDASTVTEVKQQICEKIKLPANEYFLLSSGKLVTVDTPFTAHDEIQITLKLLGGKGGFGSLLRAIGAQIEKTTNREACRDLSGRRLRDINEEKRLKTWLDKKKAEEQNECEEEKFQKKIEKLLAKPKKELNDEEYLAARKNLLENVSDSVEQGLKKARECQTILSSVGLKRKVPEECPAVKSKRVKGALWIDEGISDSDDSDEDEGVSSDNSSCEKGESSGC